MVWQALNPPLSAYFDDATHEASKLWMRGGGVIALVASLLLIIVMLIAFMFFLVLRQNTQEKEEEAEAAPQVVVTHVAPEEVTREVTVEPARTQPERETTS